MRIVLDTNVFVAAFAAHGLCEAVMELCLDQHEMAVSRELLEEIRRNLIKKAKLPEQTADEIVSFVRSKAGLVIPAQLNPSACRDADDLKILGTAIAFRADYLLTGDKDLLVVKRFHGIEIVTPRAFARILGECGE
ncbi:MAG: putative toxin-antitoxin system toxin component, PIN family [Candidatus Sumerlaeota bacterium]|nr:putative toxin-antitoxin system toxin component, PIN family [Candidatus Sumerlaeota bacterium]